MNIKDYTVVSCNNNKCGEVWIVKDNPNQTKCPTCGKTRKFHLIKKYRSVEDIERARLIRSKVKAMLSDEGDEFEKAVQKDNIMTEPTFTTGTNISSGSDSKSFEDIITEAIKESDSVPEVVEYCEEYGYEEDRVREYIIKKKQEGLLLESDSTIRFV